MRRKPTLQTSIDQWINDRLVIVKDDGRPAYKWPTSGDLYEDFREWKRTHEGFLFTQTVWGERLGQRFTRVQSSMGKHYVGVLLMPPTRAMQRRKVA
jgi:hypothetical protein